MPFSYLLVRSWKCMALPGSWLVETIQKTWSACRGFCGWRQQWQAHSKKLHLTEATEIRHLFNSESAWAPSQICCLHMRINTSASIHIRLIQIIWSWHLDWMQRFRRSGRLNVSNGTVACALPTCRFCVHVLVLSNFKMWILVWICLDGTRLHNVTHDRWAPASILFTLQFKVWEENIFDIFDMRWRSLLPFIPVATTDQYKYPTVDSTTKKLRC
jgi:hypothetical protein